MVESSGLLNRRSALKRYRGFESLSLRQISPNYIDRAYHHTMATVHITEAELARDVHAVLEKVRQGIDIVIERDSLPFAVVQATQFRGRPIDECIALAQTAGLQATLDDDFSKDLEEVIESHREPLSPPVWD